MAESKPLKVTVTNVTDGPKIFNSVTAALLHPGQKTGPLEISEAELASMRATGHFSFDDEADPALEPGPLDQSIEKLTEYLATVTDADEVQKLLDAETAGKSRTGAIAALEARRDELLA